ncbi:UNVERIFIED_CONTAM: hypothetical protein FKN15_060427 [Acipenser sinensis]
MLGTCASALALRRFWCQRFCAWCSASALCAALLRLVLSASALGIWCSSVHAPRRSTLRRIDPRCTHLDARRFGARRLTPRRSVHAPRRSTLWRFDARRFCARRVARRRLNARCTHLDARCTHLDAPTLGARTSTRDASALDASTPRRSVQAPRRSTLGARTSTLDARCMHLDARRTFDVVLDGDVGLPSLHVLPCEAACQ